jgi:hypothetical protein
MPQRFEHCRVAGNRIEYLGRTGLFEDKADRTGGEYKAWDWLEKEGWELVTVVTDRSGEHIPYFKRPVPQK